MEIDKLAATFGFEDVDFESDEFSRKFYVGCKDRKFAFAVITPQVMKLMLEKPFWRLEFADNVAIILTGMPWTVTTFRVAIETICDLLDLVPAYVWKDPKSGKELVTP